MGERHEQMARDWLADWAGVDREEREGFDERTNVEFIAALGDLLERVERDARPARRTCRRCMRFR